MSIPNIHEVHDFAKGMMKLTGAHPMVILIANADEFTHWAPEVDTDLQKSQVIEVLRQMVGALNITEFFIITEAYGRQANSEEEMKYINDNWDTESPSCYPEHMRTELLITMHTTKNGLREAMMTQIKRDSEGNFSEFLEDTEETDCECIGGEFMTLFDR